MIGRFLFRRTLARWKSLAALARLGRPETLRGIRGQARLLRRELDRALHRADGRLLATDRGLTTIPRPPLADWAWRPLLWSGPIFPPGKASVESAVAFGEGASVFHDCALAELSLRQIRNTRETDLAPFAIRFDVFQFAGSFLSLVLDLPDQALAGLRTTHLIRLEVDLEMERPLEVFARLNVKHGPNTEQIVREIPRDASGSMVEFDLSYSLINEKRLERAWLDLIFEGPDMNQIVIRDLTLTRRPRAEL